MRLTGRSDPEHYRRWREVLGAFRRALLALVSAAGLAVVGATVSVWGFLAALILAVFAVIDALLVWRWARVAATSDIDALIKGHAARVGESQANEYGVDVAVLPDGQHWLYIRRDFEEQLDAAIRGALAGTGPRLVMLCGETKAGKTRAAFQALERCELNDAWLVEPRDGACVEVLLRDGTLPEQWCPLVIWLDDIERYAAGDATGLDVSMLRNLQCDRRMLLLATEGGRGRRRYAESSELSDPVEQLRNIATCVEVPVALTDEELARTRDAYGEDFAAESEHVGLGRRMVATDELKRKLTTGQQDPKSDPCREGIAVMRAVSSWRRAGAESPLDTEQIDTLYRDYLPDDLDPSDALLARGLKWARTPLSNTGISLLRKATDGSGRFEAYDLASEVAASTWPQASGASLQSIIDIATPQDCYQLAIVAYQNDDDDLATLLFGRAEASDDERLAGVSALNLGILLAKHGQAEQAQAAYRRADKRGSAEGAFNLGNLLRERDEVKQAEAAWRRADERGSAEAAFNLGSLHKERDEMELAKDAWRRADERGSGEAAFNLGILHGEHNEPEPAEAACRRADERGHPEGAANLGVLLQERGELELAEDAWRRADERGSANGAFNLGSLLKERGELEQAEDAYRRADERGSGEGATNLGSLLKERGELKQAEDAYRRADERGNGEGASNLGILLKQQGKLEQAEDALRRADERGIGEGATSLGVLLQERGELEQAEAAYRRADERGSASGAFNLGILHRKLDEPEPAEDAYRRADERGHPDAANNLGTLLLKRGEIEQAKAAYCRADERGSAIGAFNLGILHGELNEPEPAEDAYRRADERGHPEAANNLGTLLLKRGEIERAKAAYRSAVERGSTNGALNLSNLLHALAS